MSGVVGQHDTASMKRDAVQRFQRERAEYLRAARPARPPSVTVVGNGVIGMTIAEELALVGIDDITIVSDRDVMDTTSAIAAGLIEPIAGTVDPAGLRLELEAFKHSYRAWAAEAAAVGSMVVVRKVVTYSQTRTGPLPWQTVVDGYRELDEEELHPLYREASGVEFMSFVVDTPRWLVSLRERLYAHGVRFETRRLASLDEVTGADLVINASGIGAAHLAHDPTVYRGDGHIVVVKRPPGLNDVFMDERRRLEDVARDPRRVNMVYIIPRVSDVVLGGTLFDSWDATAEPSPIAGMAERIRELTMQIEPRLSKSEVIAYRVGARPRRTAGTRLELDTTSHRMPVVHAYGTGGSGWTLAPGVARGAAILASSTWDADVEYNLG